MSLARLKGAAAYLDESQGTVSIEAAVEDQDEEVESLLNSFDVDKQAACGTLRPVGADEATAPPSKHRKVAARLMDHVQLSSSLETASAGVVVDTTLSDYQRYWNQFKDFCAAIEKVKSAQDVDGLWPDLPADFPTWIALWIMDK
ncbi:hypothetical protein CY34DRAFT_82358 [Suillus luteus UH-Slu-Lm8-n1]|uniref:Uncharacterized protein n=1 Tax=Suillus luteus UH-Slu-Lm8-n1 TaxID=930992 RepID=A0A0D0AZB2_9AGAM|nr:hypothetical protein CY34DRAFT_82358 [Suillus luteus UH-Slu-Lm8-n1]